MKHMKLMKVGAVLLLVQAICMEIGAFIMLLVAIVIQKPSIYSEHVSFALPYLQQNLVLFMIMAGIFGVLRLIGAVGILKNRLWGLVLSIIMIVVTFVLMIFMLPSGIADGILSGLAAVLILVGYFGRKKIIS